MQRAWPARTAAAAAITHLAVGVPAALAATNTTDDLSVGGAAIHVEFEPHAFRDGGDAEPAAAACLKEAHGSPDGCRIRFHNQLPAGADAG